MTTTPPRHHECCWHSTRGPLAGAGGGRAAGPARAALRLLVPGRCCRSNAVATTTNKLAPASFPLSDLVLLFKVCKLVIQNRPSVYAALRVRPRQFLWLRARKTLALSAAVFAHANRVVFSALRPSLIYRQAAITRRTICPIVLCAAPREKGFAGPLSKFWGAEALPLTQTHTSSRPLHEQPQQVVNTPGKKSIRIVAG